MSRRTDREASFEIYLIEDVAHTCYYVGSKFDGDSSRRFEMHVAGAGGARELSRNIQRRDTSWTLRVIITGFGTLRDCHAAEQQCKDLFTSNDERVCLNRIEPQRLQLTSEACAEGWQVMREMQTHEDRSRIARLALSHRTEEQKQANTQRLLAGLTHEQHVKGGKNGVWALLAANKRMTPEEWTARTRHNATTHKRKCSECGMMSYPGPLGTHQAAAGHQGWEVVNDENTVA
jgi:hypothetical protein